MPGGAGARAAAQIAKEASIGVAGVSTDDLMGQSSRNRKSKRRLLVFR